MSVTLVTWNVNSIRIRLDGLERLCDRVNPDIVCLQETKVADPLFPRADIEALGFPHIHINGIKGYGGVAILSRLPFTATDGHFWCGRADGRHCSATVDAGGRLGELEIHSLYVPAGGDEPDPEINDKFAHKLEFLAELADWSVDIGAATRNVIVAGDLNVAPLETDVWSHKQLLRVVSHTPVEVAAFEAARETGQWIDVMREFVPPSEQLYTWWSYRARDWRTADRGRRLDHIWASPRLAPHLGRMEVVTDARGWERPSDHVPVVLRLDD